MLSLSRIIDFNSHAHVERDEFQFLIGHERFNFNSHAHVERDLQAIISLSKNIYFNSHAHVERDAGNEKIVHEFTRFQLTRSRGA